MECHARLHARLEVPTRPIICYCPITRILAIARLPEYIRQSQSQDAFSELKHKTTAFACKIWLVGWLAGWLLAGWLAWPTWLVAGWLAGWLLAGWLAARWRLAGWLPLPSYTLEVTKVSLFIIFPT